MDNEYTVLGDNNDPAANAFKEQQRSEALKTIREAEVFAVFAIPKGGTEELLVGSGMTDFVSLWLIDSVSVVPYFFQAMQTAIGEMFLHLVADIGKANKERGDT